MKKGLLTILLAMFALCSCAQARTIYDKYGRIVKDDSLRGQKRAAYQKTHSNVAAAAKIDYDKALNELNYNTGLKSNYYQDIKNKTNY